jgi:hypothetical protein
MELLARFLLDNLIGLAIAELAQRVEQHDYCWRSGADDCERPTRPDPSVDSL